MENNNKTTPEEIKDVIRKELLYQEILKELDGDDFFIDYETYEEME